MRLLKMPSIPVCALAALLLCGYTAAIAVMSVDLGSEWMKVAVVSPGVPMEIALNPASKRKTAVAVSLKDGERMFGADALVQGVKSPKHCYKYMLDLLGKKFDHPLVTRFQSQFPYYTLVPDPVRGTVLFQHDSETTYSPEELLGMILFHAKGQAEAFTEQKVKDVVITAPIYFNQAERQALVAAAQLGGLNVLQLINVPSAVALNYGMFRRKEINGTAKNLMFYDMGAQDTTAVVVGFQIVKTKERGFTETHPQAQILGVGYDRTLGGLEITLRLQKYLAQEFNKMGKTKTDVFNVPRAMAKIFKEADRVKTILSANTDFYAQIENVMEDIDFKHQVTRDKLLELSSDLMERVTGPVDDALKTAAMSMEAIDQVIIVGGGTRVPKVQDMLVNTFKKELGKNLNADEAAAMGAVYKAADLSTGFKVKKFISKEAVVFSIDVDFEREYETEAGEKGIKKVKRTLFSRMNPYPQKKIMTFNKHVKDFKFNVYYEDLGYLGATESSYVGSPNVSTVEVKGVAEALEKNKGDNVETKGVKAHFFLDDSGILSCTTIESVFEKTISPEEQEKAEKEGKKDDDSWAKLGSTISQFFSPGDKKEGEDKEVDDEEKDSKKPGDEKKDDKEKKTKGEKYDSKEGAPKKDKKDEKTKEEEKKDKEPKKPKIETLKEELSQEYTRVDTIILEGDSFDASRKKLEDLDKADEERHEHETALNELQSFVYDMQDKLYMEEYESASTEEEKEKIKTLCTETSDWLDEEVGPFTPTQELKDKLKALKELTSALFARVREHSERPEAIQALANTLNSSSVFLAKSRMFVIKEMPKKTGKDKAEKRNKTVGKDDNIGNEKTIPVGEHTSANLTGGEDDLGYFKEKELDVLAKKIEEVEKWRNDKIEEQKATPLSEMPKLTVNMIVAKITDLDSEVKFLVSTAKMRKAEKEREKRKKEAEEKKAEEEAKKKAKKEEKEKKKSKIIEEGSEETKENVEESEDTKPEETGDSKQSETPAEEKPIDADTSATPDDTEKSEESETPEKSEEDKDASEADNSKTEL